MNFSDFYFGRRPLKGKKAMVEYLKKKYSDDHFDHAKLLSLWSSSNKESWIAFADNFVYKILDKKDEDAPIVNWKIRKNAFEKIVDGIKVFEENHKKRIAFPHKLGKKYLFDERLFQEGDVREVFKKAIESTSEEDTE